MVKTTPTELISTAQSFANDHQCRYAQEIISSKEFSSAQTVQDLGSVASMLNKIDLLLLDLQLLHKGRDCPPAYVGRAMTHEWMLWTGDIAMAEMSVRQVLGARATTLAA